MFGWAVAALLGSSTAPMGAHSPPSLEIGVQIRCEELSEEERAAIEARQLGELITRGVSAGELELICGAQVLVASWTKPGRSIPLQERVLRADDQNLDEQLHRLAARLMEQTSKTVEEETSAEPVASTTLTNDTEQSATLVEAEAPSEPQANAALSRAVEPKPRNESRSARGQDFEWSVLGAFRYYHWGKEVPGAWGPAVGIQLDRGVWGGAAAFSPQWSAGSVEGISIQEYNIELNLIARPFPAFSVLFGPCYSALLARTTLEFDSGSTSSRRFGAQGQVLWTQATRMGNLFASAGLRWLGARREVLLDESAILRVPAVQVLLSAGLRLQL